MPEIQWGNDLDEAKRRAMREGKPIYLDFWFEG